MANEYTVNAADLTAVADAIRAKTGTSEGLSFPDGFAAAIAGISTGTQVASGSVNASQSFLDSMTITPGFVVKNICFAVAYNTSTYKSAHGGGMYIDGVISGDIESITSDESQTIVTFSKGFAREILWLATS